MRKTRIKIGALVMVAVTTKLANAKAYYLCVLRQKEKKMIDLSFSETLRLGN